MNKIFIKSEPKHFQDVFVQVFKTNGNIKEGVVYTFVEFPDNQLIRSAICVDLQVLERKDLTNQISFLDAQCDLDVYEQILDNRGLSIDQLLTVATFSHIHKSKKYYNVKQGIFNQNQHNASPKSKPKSKAKNSPNTSYEQPVLLLG